MKIEFRHFLERDARTGEEKPIDVMLLLPQTETEKKQLDHFFGPDSVNFENSQIMSAFLCCDEGYNPYIRVTTPRLLRQKIVDGVLITEEKLVGPYESRTKVRKQ